ncbi:MAG: HEAT repeat domain-containing protein [Myxococcota bacterium]|nr:HEAT repeat domain-containing protein [Myxococcota bacterium]MDW8362304.1 HEAT repeat domain-containing protein [Myxococcales bacterium]
MARIPDELDTSPLPDVPDVPDEPPAAARMDLGDDEALRKMGRRTSTVGRITAVVLVGGAVAAGWFAYTSSKKYEARHEVLAPCAELERGSEAQLQCLRAAWPQTDYDDVQERILLNLGEFRDGSSDAVRIYTEALSRPGIVRRAAARAIARVGLPAAEPTRARLLEVLPQTDERDRVQVVWALAVVRERAAADAVIDAFKAGLLQQQPGFDPKIIADVIGPDRLGSDELLTHSSEAVRTLVAHALAEAAGPQVVGPLVRLLEAETRRERDAQSTEVIRAAAAGLGRTGSPEAAGPLFTLLSSRPDLTQGILDALRKTTGATALAALLPRATEVAVRRDIVRLLAELRDARVSDALASLLSDGDADIRSTAAFALADVGDPRAVPTLVTLAGGEDEGEADAALRALRLLGHASAVDGLLALLPPTCPPEPEPGMPLGCTRQAGILAALGGCGDPRAADRIARALDGVDAPAAAMALARLNHEPSYRRLRDMAVRPPNVDMTAPTAADRSLENEDLLRRRKAAILALGVYGRPDAADVLMRIVEDRNDDYELRALAGESLGRCATAEILRQVAAKVQDAGLDDATRRYYTRALRQKAVPEANAALLEVVRATQPTEIRNAAAVAIGYSADPALDPVLVELLGDERTRLQAAIATVLGGGPEPARRLVATLVEDRDLREVLQELVMGETDDFNVITAEMFERGGIWRRLETARILMTGTETMSFAHAWARAVQALRAGWEGPGGMPARLIRERLWSELNGQDARRRALVAELLAAMNDRGLLLRARDENTAGAPEARAQLLRMLRPANPDAPQE